MLLGMKKQIFALFFASVMMSATIHNASSLPIDLPGREMLNIYTSKKSESELM